MGHANEPLQLGLETWTLADISVLIFRSTSDLAIWRQVRHLSGPRLESVAQTRLVCSTNSSGY
jgi:hypothetical protein